MRILFLQILPSSHDPGFPRFDDQLGVLSSVLREDNHATGLLSVARYDETSVRRKIVHFRPQMVYADIAATGADLARRL